MKYFEITDFLKKKLVGATDLEEVIQICADEGISVTREQLEAELAKNAVGELDAESLDTVNGGFTVVTPAIIAGIAAIWYYFRNRN